MKTTLLLFALLFSSLSMAQSMNDTLYFNSGEVRPVHITRESNSAIKYNYTKGMGQSKSSRVRKRMIRGYVILDEQNNVLSTYENPIPLRETANNNNVGAGLGIFFVGIGAIGAVVVGGFYILANLIS
jgi:hypothetical protein